MKIPSKQIITAVAFLICLSWQLPSKAETQPIIQEIGPWKIGVDETLEFGCFMFRSYDNGRMALRIGWDPTTEQLYIMIANSDWGSLEEGKQYDTKIQFDGRPIWDAPMVGFRMGTLITLKVVTDDPDFLKEFAKFHHMQIDYRGRKIANLSLRGSFKATAGFIGCIETVETLKADNEFPSTGTDPFSVERVRPVRDPFAQ